MPRRDPSATVFWGGLARRTRIEWVVVTLALAALTLLLNLSSQQTGLQRLDYALYDLTLADTSQRPARQDIVIITLDDGSIARLGHWPWRRSVHADLLARLSQARAVGLDIMFTEPQRLYPQDDATLAAAIAGHGRVVLPQATATDNVLQPLATLRDAAAGMGVINIHPDSDGTIRAINLTPRDHQGKPQDHLILSLLDAGGNQQRADALRAQDKSTRLLPYAGPPGHFRHVPYSAVLAGDVPADTFAGKYVLVGAWATGLGDAFPTPLSNGIPMAGVEILANGLQSSLDDLWISTPATWLSAALSVLPVLAACLMLRRRSPRQAFFSAAAIIVLVFAGHWLLLHMLLIWVPVSASLIGVALCYPIWSWRSQDLSLRHVDQELRKLQDEHTAFKEDMLTLDDGPHDQSLSARIVKLHTAIGQLRNLRQFFTDSLDATPDATLIFDLDGMVRFASHRAKAYADAIGANAPVNGQHAHDSLARIATDAQLRQDIVQSLRRDHGQVPQGAAIALWQDGLELRDAHGNDMLLKCVSIRTASGTDAGSILTLIDISALRQAQRRREETLRFLSHDMRSPQNSILALAQLQQQAATALPQDQLLGRIGQYATRTLELVDGFVQLARAESMDIQTQPINLPDLLMDAADTAWALAQQRHIAIDCDALPETACVLADASLLGRAIGNLIDNAIKYSPDHTHIRCSLQAGGSDWILRISDQGRGIPAAKLATIFMPFTRADEHTPNNPVGTGLGLAFVHTIIHRHGGTIDVQSQEGHGSTFIIRLPASDIPD